MANANRVNLQKSYSALNEKLAKVFDESGVKRSFTVPYIEGQSMSDHIQAVQQAATKAGGLAANLVTTYHHGAGKGWGSGDGHTIAHPAGKLKDTIIPDDDENAKAAIAAAQTHLNNVGKLIGEDNPVLQTANGQLNLVKKTEGAGMNLMDFGVLLTQITYAPNQAVARTYNGTKQGGHQSQLRGPMEESTDEGQEGSENDQEGAGEAQGENSAPEASATPEAAPASAAAPATQG